MVKLILEYAAIVWAPHTKRDERTQRQEARFVKPATTLVMLASHKYSQISIVLHLHDADMNKKP